MLLCSLEQVEGWGGALNGRLDFPWYVHWSCLEHPKQSWNLGFLCGCYWSLHWREEKVEQSESHSQKSRKESLYFGNLGQEVLGDQVGLVFPEVWVVLVVLEHQQHLAYPGQLNS